MNTRKMLDEVMPVLNGTLIAVAGGFQIIYIQPDPSQEEIEREKRLGFGIPGSVIQATLRQHADWDRRILREALIPFVYKEPDKFDAEKIVIDIFIFG
jgi:hypothetical protein